jgi:hypothetical protein
MLQTARRAAGLWQSELARRGGVAQPVINAHESDGREPSLVTLTKLIEATGHRLAVDVIPGPCPVRGLADIRLGRRVWRHRRAVVEIAGRRAACDVRVFGSVARGRNFTPLVDVRTRLH